MAFIPVAAILAEGGISLGKLPAPVGVLIFVTVAVLVVISTVRRIRKGR